VGIAYGCSFPPAFAPDPALLKEEAIEAFFLARTDEKSAAELPGQNFSVLAFEYLN
jgi:hypothetical protein